MNGGHAAIYLIFQDYVSGRWFVEEYMIDFDPRQLLDIV